MKTQFARRVGLLAFLMAVFAAGPLAAQDYVDRYAIAPGSVELDFAVIPHSYPNGVVGAVMRRDLILRAALSRLAAPLKTRAFKTGVDMLPLVADRRLDAGLMGDMPSTIAAAAGKVWIVGLVEVTENAIVTRGGARVDDLAGKRIGYTALTTAHAALVRGLALAKLSTADVTLVPLANADLPDALARREIDAFAGWEPSISLALAASAGNRIVFRGKSVDYFVLNREFERQSPEAARVLIAGLARAVDWMRRSSKNTEAAARWALADGREFSGAQSGIAVSRVVAITRSGLLDVPSAPVIVKSPGDAPLKVEYDLLKSLAKLPADERWDHVVTSFQYDGLRQVMADPSKYSLREFSYEE
jgi:sulfonate transport system substrate-binding protein